MNHVLITGGAGYIGTITAQHFLKLGYQVSVIDNLHRGFLVGTHANTRVYNINLCNQIELENIFNKNKFDFVIHLAALAFVSESVANPELYLNNNITSTQNVVNMCLKYSVKKIIFSSSCTIYGNENEHIRLTEVVKIKSINPYGTSKIECEKIIKNSGLDFIILRYFNVAGADVNNQLGHLTDYASHLVHALSRAAVFKKEIIINGSGSCVRDYIHVSDVALIHELASKYLLNEKNVSEVINCGSGEGYSVNEVVSQFEIINSLHIPKVVAAFRTGDPEFLVADATKLVKLLGWKSVFKNSFEQICKSSYNWEISKYKASVI